MNWVIQNDIPQFKKVFHYEEKDKARITKLYNNKFPLHIK